jgi:hypothetical protein
MSAKFDPHMLAMAQAYYEEAKVMMSEPTYERVLAKDVQPGDRIGRTRKGRFDLVTAKRENAETVWLTFVGGHRIRPHFDVKLWKLA